MPDRILLFTVPSGSPRNSCHLPVGEPVEVGQFDGAPFFVLETQQSGCSRSASTNAHTSSSGGAETLILRRVLSWREQRAASDRMRSTLRP